MAAVLVICAAVALFFFRIRKKREYKTNLRLNQTLQQLISQDQYEYYLVDVRSEGEFRKGHIPTAVNVPYGELNSYLPTDDLFANIVVYGRSPLQSSRAAGILSDAGYFNVTSFGPVFRWRGPVSRGNDTGEDQKKSV